MKTLCGCRLEYQPKLPSRLLNIDRIMAVEKEVSYTSQSIHGLFPKSVGKPFLHFEEGKPSMHEPLRVGVVLSGGQAAGGHNVITGLYDALKKLNSRSQLFGFLNGPAGIMKCDSIEITADFLEDFRNQGGFDMIGAGRDKIESEEQFQQSKLCAEKLSLDGIVIVGGDDSNTNAALLAEYFLREGVQTRVIGVPKTIDGDLKNEHIEVSFGFDTASKTFSNTIGNICRDALSAKKYYFFIKLMGRSASHIALECALQTHSNLTFIGEEIAAKKKTLKQLTDELYEMIVARQKVGKNYGVILIPEGVIEFIPEMKTLIQELNRLDLTEDVKSKLTPESLSCFESIPPLIQEQLLMDRDPHGNVQVSKIETERLFIEALKTRDLKKFSAQPLFLGYEGRSCLPSNFDSDYCYALGHVAALLIENNATGYMACVKNLVQSAESWEPIGVPLTTMIELEERKGKQKPVITKALVDLEGSLFQEFSSKRESWKLDDDYLYPGPIQFFGPPEITDCVNTTLAHSSAELTKK